MLRRARLITAARGNLVLLVGLIAQAVTTYLFLIVSGRSLGPIAFGAVSGLYVLVTSIATGLFQPLEQEVARRRGHERAGSSRDATLGRRALGHGYVASLWAVALMLLILPVTLKAVGGEVGLLWSLSASLPGYALWFVVRGELSGERRLARYGVQLMVDGSFRLAGALLLVAVDSTDPVAYGALLAASPWVAVLLGSIGSARGSRREPTGQSATPRPLTRDVYLLMASALAGQLLINAGTLVVAFVADSSETTEVGVFLSAMVVIRVPVFLFAAVQPTFLPAMAQCVAEGDAPRFRGLLTRVLGVVVLFTVLNSAAITLVGPPVISWLFAFDVTLSRTTYLLLTTAVGLFLLATVLAQALLGLGRHAWTSMGWLAGLVGLAVGTQLASTSVDRATAGILTGAVVATAALAAATFVGLATWQRAQDRPRRRATERAT